MKTTVIVAAAALLAFTGSAAHAQRLFGTAADADSGHGSNLLAGMRAGHNWQNSAFVYGLEAGLPATSLGANLNTMLTGTSVFPIVPAPTAVVSQFDCGEQSFGCLQ